MVSVKIPPVPLSQTVSVQAMPVMPTAASTLADVLLGQAVLWTVPVPPFAAIPPAPLSQTATVALPAMPAVASTPPVVLLRAQAVLIFLVLVGFAAIPTARP